MIFFVCPGESVHVFVDPLTEKPTPINTAWREGLSLLNLRPSWNTNIHIWKPTPLFLYLLSYSPPPPWNPTPLFLSLLSYLPPPWNPTPLFLSLLSFPLLHEILRPCFCLCSLTPPPPLHEILHPCFCLYSLIPPPPWNPTPLCLSLLSYRPSSYFTYSPIFFLPHYLPPSWKSNGLRPSSSMIPLLLRILRPSLLIPHSRKYYVPVFVHALLIPLLLRNLRPCSSPCSLHSPLLLGIQRPTPYFCPWFLFGQCSCFVFALLVHPPLNSWYFRPWRCFSHHRPLENLTPLFPSLLPSSHPKKPFAPASVVFALSPKNLIFFPCFPLPLFKKIFFSSVSVALLSSYPSS